MASLATKLIAYTSYCITNTANIICTPLFYIVPILEDNHDIDGDPSRTFYHPLMQTEMMVIGQMLCLLAFSFSKGTSKEESRPSTKP